jgi:DNA invertase Pin-like site-specific DNA recombinase
MKYAVGRVCVTRWRHEAMPRPQTSCSSTPARAMPGVRRSVPAARATSGCRPQGVCTYTVSGAKADRPGLEEALDFVRAGDTVVVWKLDRLGRSLPHLLETVAGLQERGNGFKSLTEQIDTTTSGGKLIFHVFAALAEFEQDVIRERTQAGLAAARARGRKGGRPPSAAFSDANKVALTQRLYDDTTNSIDDICRTLRVSRSTLYRYIKTID